ncbi:MAG TPA: polysaccharide deacetylase family protein [Saprospiraceae bacterium]|nr:polysaccharide deacetylase family protein [Saprospiraceae bacterium]
MMTKLLYKILRYSGLPVIFREFIQRDKVTILMLHDINLQSARRSFEYLSRKYNFISLRAYVDALKNERTDGIPPKALIVTFDDGHKGNYELLPLLKQYQIPATIFLCAGIVDTNRHYWFKHDYTRKLPPGIKLLKNSERLKLLEKYGYSSFQEYPERHAMRKEEIKSMQEVVDFQAHTVFHPCLPTCSEEEELAEIKDSKHLLEQKFDLDVYAIAYPNGDYSDRTVEMSRNSGFQCGVTVDYGFNSMTSDPYRLKRLSINDTGDLNELIVKSSGLWGFLKTRNGKKNGYTPVVEH